jgi:hypothetical protein
VNRPDLTDAETGWLLPAGTLPASARPTPERTAIADDGLSHARHSHLTVAEKRSRLPLMWMLRLETCNHRT